MSSGKPKMEYRLVGKTGLRVSVLSLGTMTFHTVERAVALMECVREYGVNFFDTAEAYGTPRGLVETNLGKALKQLQKRDPSKWRREDLVITTKLFIGPQFQQSELAVNEVGLTRKHLFEGMAGSLRRMQLPYVDIVYAHRPDPLTSVEQIVRSFTQLVRSGKAFHWGTSMWTPTQLVEAHWVAKLHGLEAPVIEQPVYSMLDRSVMEKAYLPLFQEPYHMATSIWNVLDRGILAGKYLDKANPAKGRLSDPNNRLGQFVGGMDHVTREKNSKVRKLKVVADNLNCSTACLAVAWLIKNDHVTTCMLGATKVFQLHDCLQALSVANKITPQILLQIDHILQNKPLPGPLDRVWRTNDRIISRL